MDDGTTVLVDRNHKGTTVHRGPGREAGGDTCPIVGLDATARESLWSVALGHDVETADIHDTPRHRRAFLRDVLNVQVVQTSPHAKFYEGRVGNLAGDEALVREVARSYSGSKLRRGKFSQTTKPAVLTTKRVREELEPRITDVAGAVEHYGNVTGSNALSDHNLAVVLGTQHYGDRVLEQFAALAGEEVTRSGRGMNLDYGSDVANEYLRLMSEDQTMQAILRFGRDEEGALVFAHTAAIREDVPVVADGDMVEAFSKGTLQVAQAARGRVGGRFTVDDLADEVDVSRRTVQRALAELTELGHLNRHKRGEGRANSYRTVDDPGTGVASLPELEGPGSGTEADPDGDVVDYYTWSVGVRGANEDIAPTRRGVTSQLPPPEAEQTAGPPG
jgi:DNA-binding transcriptional ArsR family regulator